MAEPLLKKHNFSESDLSSGKDEVYDAFKHELKERKKHHSKCQRILAFTLLKFHSCQISVIFVGFFFGFLTLGLPSLLVYHNRVKNIIIPFLFVSIFTLVFSILLIIIHVLNGNKNKYVLIEKWERKNILKNIGMLFRSIIIIIAMSLIIQFYDQVNEDLDNESIILDKQNSTLSQELEADFIFKYTLNMIFFIPSEMNTNNEKFNVKYYFSEQKINELRNYLMISLIPLLILSFNKIIKTILIQVKYTLEQLTCFFGTLLFCLFNIIINGFSYEKISQLNIKTISLFQNVNIIIIYIGYIAWTLHNSFKLLLNPKDNNFSIKKYKLLNILLILIFDLVLIVGATLFVLSILYLFISSLFGEETFKNLNISFTLLKCGFLLIIIGNSYYFGHYLLSMIFRPVATQCKPFIAKNESYVKANRKLRNAMNTRNKIRKINNVT